jgi:aspartate aminotransferase/aminotransferase
VGFAIGPAEIVEKMMVLQQFSYVCAPSIAQQAMIPALDLDPHDWIEKNYRRKRDIAYEMLKDSLDVRRPQGSFYIWPKAPGGDADRFVQRALERRVIIVPGKTCSRRNSHFRLSYAMPDSVLRQGLEVLRTLATK